MSAERDTLLGVLGVALLGGAVRTVETGACMVLTWGTKFMSCDGPYALHHMVDIACWEYCIPNNTMSEAVNRGIINVSWPFPVYSFINSLFQAFR